MERLIRRGVAEAGLAERQKVLEDLRGAVRGAEDPEVLEMERRIEPLREMLERSPLDDEREEP